MHTVVSACPGLACVLVRGSGNTVSLRPVCAQRDRLNLLVDLRSNSVTSQVVVFSWTGCPFCKKAKALLTDLGADFTAVELDLMGKEGSALRAELGKARIGKTLLFGAWFLPHRPSLFTSHPLDFSCLSSLCKTGVCFETRKRSNFCKDAPSHI